MPLQVMAVIDQLGLFTIAHSSSTAAWMTLVVWRNKRIDQLVG